MNYLATVILSVLSIRWPVVGITSFLLAYTGMAGFFEELRILGTQVGAVRPDNIAVVVSILVLLRRQPAVRLPQNVKILMGLLTAIVPVGMFFASSNTYEFLSNCWRIFFWAPLFFAFLRLTEKEWQTLQNVFIALMAINALITFRIIRSNDHELYRRLGTIRLFSFDAVDTAAAMAFSPSEALRLVLPGTYDFGSITVFICLMRILSSQISRYWRLTYFALLMSDLLLLYFSVSRTSAAAVILGSIVLVLFLLPDTQIKQKAGAFATVALASLGIVMILGHYSAAGTLWSDRMTGSTDHYLTGHYRIEKNLQYFGILSQSNAIIGHPNFEQASIVAGRQEHVIAPLAMWWTHGLIAAICYCSLIIYFVWSMIRLNRTAISFQRRAALAAAAGMLMAYFVEHLSGAGPLGFIFPFNFSYVLASCAWIVFPRAQAAMPRAKRFHLTRKPYVG
jgi:hypothetical protein